MNFIIKNCKNDPHFFVKWIKNDNQLNLLQWNQSKQMFFINQEISFSIQNPVLSPDKTQMIFFKNQSVQLLTFKTMKSKIILENLKGLNVSNIESLSDVQYGWLSINEIVIALKKSNLVRFYTCKYSNDIQSTFQMIIKHPFHFHVRNGKMIIAQLNYTKKTTVIKLFDQNSKSPKIKITLNGVQQYLNPKLSPCGDKLGMIYDKKSLPVGLNSLYDFWIFNLTSRKLYQVTQDIKWIKFEWISNEQILGLKNFGAFNQIYSYNIKTAKLKQLTDEDFSIEDFDFFNDQVVYVGNDVFGKTHTKSLNILNQKVPVKTLLSNNERFQKIKWNGFYNNMQGLMILPPGYQKSKRYRLIVDVHGGGPGSSMFLTGSILRYCSQEWFLFSSMFDTIIFIPEFRLSGVYDNNVFSSDFIRGSVDDINSGVDYLIRKKLVQKDQIALIGGSYGALIANFMPVITNRYICIISVEGWIKHDLNIDPLTIKTQTPMLFVQGNPKLGGHENDNDIKSYHQKLIRSGVKSEYLYINNEGHVFYKPHNIRKIFSKVISWLKFYFE